jgi:hypothetical protein
MYRLYYQAHRAGDASSRQSPIVLTAAVELLNILFDIEDRAYTRLCVVILQEIILIIITTMRSSNHTSVTFDVCYLQLKMYYFPCIRKFYFDIVVS